MPTLQDVAREAGLSVGTVSRVLNNRGYISDETRESVHRAMKKLHYQPNEVARSLSKKSSNTIGVIVPSVEHPYFARLISALERAVHRAGCRMILFCSRGREEQEEAYIADCVGLRAAGVIICSGGIRTEKFRNLGFPLIAYERPMDEANAAVECDNFQGGQLAGGELIDRGCRHLLCIRGIAEVPMPADRRLDGFLDVCERKGVQGESVTVEPFAFDEMNYYPVIRDALDRYPETDGIFAGSDIIAAQVIRICGERGIRIPEEMKVVGYDDVFLTDLITPPVTSVHQPVEEMADCAVQLLTHLREGATVAQTTVFPVTLVRREST